MRARYRPSRRRLWPFGAVRSAVGRRRADRPADRRADEPTDRQARGRRDGRTVRGRRDRRTVRGRRDGQADGRR